jgi:hypothetical protein
MVAMAAKAGSGSEGAIWSGAIGSIVTLGSRGLRTATGANYPSGGKVGIVPRVFRGAEGVGDAFGGAEEGEWLGVE